MSEREGGKGAGRRAHVRARHQREGLAAERRGRTSTKEQRREDETLAEGRRLKRDSTGSPGQGVPAENPIRCLYCSWRSTHDTPLTGGQHATRRTRAGHTKSQTDYAD